jgi:beta-xylosidase
MISPTIQPADSIAVAPPCAFPWRPDQGDGSFRNPILCADYSDPDVIRHGDDFYLTASSFNCTPGLPILHSRDLVNWTIVHHAVKRLPHPRYAEVQPGCGIWAPAIRFHAGKFWIFFPMPDEGIYVTTADEPTGPWSEPHLVQAGKGLIDPCPLWDSDGHAYLVHAFARSRAGFRDKLRVCPMSPDGSRLLGEGQIVIDAPDRQPTIEGPKFLQKDGWYYILAPAGGVTTGWQTVLRARHIYGPYEERIVLEQGSTPINGPHQGALVDLPGGEWWFVHFQDVGVYGRVVHLQPVHWKEGWPLMGWDRRGSGIGEPVLHHRKPNVGRTHTIAIPQSSDEFAAPHLGLQWQWYANYQDDWYSLSARNSWLRLFAQRASGADLGKVANLLLQKFPARTFSAETLIDCASTAVGEEAGLVVVGGAYASIAVRRGDRSRQIVFRNNGADTVVKEVAVTTVRFRVAVGEVGLCQFSFAINGGGWTHIPERFQAQPGIWIGAKVGLYAINSGTDQAGHADFDYFRFAPAPAERA